MAGTSLYFGLLSSPVVLLSSPIVVEKFCVDSLSVMENWREDLHVI